jgi:hypothetical protein
LSLPISRSVAIQELKSVAEMTAKWVSILQRDAPIEGASENGLPAVDYPGAEIAFVQAMQQLSSELVICAGKCENLAEVIFNGSR